MQQNSTFIKNQGRTSKVSSILTMLLFVTPFFIFKKVHWTIVGFLFMLLPFPSTRCLHSKSVQSFNGWIIDSFELEKCCSTEQVGTAVVLLEEIRMLAIEKLV